MSRQALDRAEATVEELEAEREAAVSARESSRQRVEAARADRRSARIRLGEARVTAPADGRVEHQLVRVGDDRGQLADGFPADVFLRVDPSVPWPEREPW